MHHSRPRARAAYAVRLALAGIAALTAVALLGAAALASSPPGPVPAGAPAAKKRYYIEVEVAKDKTDGGKPLADQVVKAMGRALVVSPLFVIAAPGDGAPPNTDEAARRAWLKSKDLVGLSLQLTIAKITEKKEKSGLTLTFELSALLITRPGGWMIISTKGIGEADGYARAPVLESCVEGAAAGAAENLIAHLVKKPVSAEAK